METYVIIETVEKTVKKRVEKQKAIVFRDWKAAMKKVSTVQ